MAQSHTRIVSFFYKTEGMSSIQFICLLKNYILLAITKLPNNELTGIHTLSLPPLLL